MTEKIVNNKSPITQCSNPSIVIRQLELADLPTVLAIERDAFLSPWSAAMFVLELAKPTSICLAAVNGSQLVGYLICSNFDGVWHLLNICVVSTQRRQRVADQLLQQMLVKCGDWTARYTLEVRRSNTAAIKLYERNGFAAAGIRSGYYQDNGEDAIIMWRTAGTRAGTFSDVPNADPHCLARSVKSDLRN